MAAVERYTDPYLRIYRPVPPAGVGVCAVCHSGPAPGYPICSSCDLTMRQVSRPVPAVLPISLFTVGDQYWYILRQYKDHPRPQVRKELSLTLAATIARFTACHWSCIGAHLGDHAPTLVATVPSTRSAGRPLPHPLVGVVQRIHHLAVLHEEVLVRGPGEVGHRQAHDDVFRPIRDLRQHRVLLIEDTFTTGARAQSAATALHHAGAAAVTVVTAGRVINPDWNDNCHRIWQSATETSFTFDRCAWCEPR
jgi:hypothetical protein